MLKATPLRLNEGMCQRRPKKALADGDLDMCPAERGLQRELAGADLFRLFAGQVVNDSDEVAAQHRWRASSCRAPPVADQTLAQDIAGAFAAVRGEATADRVPGSGRRSLIVAGGRVHHAICP